MSNDLARAARSTPESPGHRRWWWIPAIVLLALSPFVVVGGIALYWKVSGTPLIDEWHCSEGEAPYAFPEGGGSACAPEGSMLPEGATWDPFGNRPFSCHDRWGWVDVEPSSPSRRHQGTECVREGEPLPDGWRPVK